MSMICNLRRASDDQIAQLLIRPREIRPFLYGPEVETAPSGFFASLYGGAKKASAPATPWEPPASGDEIDLDKAWHGLHFLFTGSEWEGEEPLCYLVSGGTEIGRVDVGYGPARALSSTQAKQFALALSLLSVDELKSRFSPDRMTALDIYPPIWDRGPEDDDTLGYLISYLEELRLFLNETATRQMGLIVYIN
jgi:hypothetical protein